MSALAECLLADLRGWAGQLTDQGLGARGVAKRVSGPLTDAFLLGSVLELCRLVPSLIRELESEPEAGEEEVLSTARPPLTRLSTRPGDWTRTRDGRWVPERWTEIAARMGLRADALGWLLHFFDVLDRDLIRARERAQKHLAAARVAREGRSSWARQDAAQLDEHARRFARAAALLNVQRRFLLCHGDGRLRPTTIAPRVYPRGRSWRLLRALAAHRLASDQQLAARLVELLVVDPPQADVPTLYQRWCGMRIVQALEELGWKPEGDVMGPLFLAGGITFRDIDGSTIMLHVETRITSARGTPVEFHTKEGHETTPDYLLLFPGPGGRDAYVLDPTLSCDDDAMQAKNRYVQSLEGDVPSFVAGVPSGLRRPLRAWAAAPIRLDRCRPFVPSGSAGVVPMNPIAWTDQPLLAWLRDLTRHAKAWA